MSYSNLLKLIFKRDSYYRIKKNIIKLHKIVLSNISKNSNKSDFSFFSKKPFKKLLTNANYY